MSKADIRTSIVTVDDVSQDSTGLRQYQLGVHDIQGIERLDANLYIIQTIEPVKALENGGGSFSDEELIHEITLYTKEYKQNQHLLHKP